MKIHLEMRQNRPLLITEDEEIVENVEVTGIKPVVETTKEGHVSRLVVEIKILEQHEVRVK